jgi:hypothetical protein
LIAAHNRLVAGSSPAGPTTHSAPIGDFLARDELRRIGAVLGPYGTAGDGSPEVGWPFSAVCLWPQNPVSRKRRPPRAETRFECGAYCEGRPSIWCWRRHSAGRSARRATPIPRGSRPAIAALTRSGATKASEIVIFTLRTLQPSRSAMVSAVTVASEVSSVIRLQLVGEHPKQKVARQVNGRSPAKYRFASGSGAH